MCFYSSVQGQDINNTIYIYFKNKRQEEIRFHKRNIFIIDRFFYN
jgi:hypothetical protein